MPQKISTCLTFQGQAEEAMKFYASVFADAKIVRTDRTPPSVAKMSGATEGSVLAVVMKLGELEILALNGPPFVPTPATSLFVACPSIPEIEKMWAKLIDGGEIRMALEKQPWGAEKYGWVKDKFGVEWQLINSPHPKTSYGNCMLFVDKQFG
ncbi:MAG: VOC family protein, partial [Bdellovibrionota bacterium]